MHRSGQPRLSFQSRWVLVILSLIPTAGLAAEETSLGSVTFAVDGVERRSPSTSAPQ